MDYEKKHKEALKRARELHDNHALGKPFIYKTCEDIFPELKESEDERIRKKVIDVLKFNVKGAESQMQASRGVDRTFEIYACNKVIAWLEKQGEQKPIISNNAIREGIAHFGITQYQIDNWLKKYVDVETQDELQYWKPSKEQLEALDYAYNSCPDTERGNYYEGVLRTLIDELYKLQEKQGEKSNIHQDAEDDLRRQHTIRVLEYARGLDDYNQYGKESIDKDIAWLEKQGRDLEPIPLTEEFFENNGFVLDNSFYPYYKKYESEDKRIIITDETNSGDGYWYVQIDNEDYETIGGCDVKYVHQFQQLLKLCRYEMDVVV